MFLSLGEDELWLFLDEMEKHLDALETELHTVEEQGSDSGRVARLIRAADRIKKVTAAVGLDGMALMTHCMKILFHQMRSGRRGPMESIVPLLLRCIDYLRQSMTRVRECQSSQPIPQALLMALGRAGSGVDYTGAAVLDEEGRLIHVQVLMTPACQLPAIRALQVLLALKTRGELILSEPAEDDLYAGHRTTFLSVWMITKATCEDIKANLSRMKELAEVIVDEECSHGDTRLSAPSLSCSPQGDEPLSSSEQTIRVDVSLLDDLRHLVGELVMDQGKLAGIERLIGQGDDAIHLSDQLGHVTAHLTRITGTLQQTVLKARMLPVRSVFGIFPDRVRDLARKLGKQVDLSLVGGDTKLDRLYLEVLRDSLTPLLYNALIYSIETPDERHRAGKPETAVLRLSAGYQENHVAILMQDDGRGFKPEELRAAAVHKGLLNPKQAQELSDDECLLLLFAPGFADCAPQDTHISERGLGFDAVRQTIEQVGGCLAFESQPGFGCTFRILLPLTAAAIQALLVRVDTDIMALPVSTTVEVIRVEADRWTRVGGRWVSLVRGHVVPLVWLKQFISPGFCPQHQGLPLVVVLVNYKAEIVGLVVDHLIGEQEVVVNERGKYSGQKGVSGVAIVGNGNLALIIDTPGVIDTLAARLNKESSCD